MRRRRSRLRDWSPTEWDRKVDRARLFAEASTLVAFGINATLTVVDAAHGNWTGAGISAAGAAFITWSRAIARRRFAETESYGRKRIEIEGERREPSLDELVRDGLPGIAQATAFTLTSIVGRALAEGYDVDDIIAASNLPPDMIRHYAAQAEKGFSG